MSNNQELQIKLHKKRAKIISLKLEIEKLRDSRNATAPQIAEIEFKIKTLESSNQ
jgi:hypothetical protein